MRGPHVAAFVFLVFVAAVNAYLAIGCTNHRAREHLELQGYRDVTIAGDCGGSVVDTCTAFSATAGDGRRVFGSVFCAAGGCDRTCRTWFGR